MLFSEETVRGYLPSDCYSHDALGNPIDYGDVELWWEDGRRLSSILIDNQDLDVYYTYDSDGLRTSKTVNGVKHEYLYDGDKVLYEKRGEDQFFYYYDSYGHFSAIRHICAADNTDYIYYANTNSRGDVIGLYNGPGTQIVSYEYDAWGNVISMVDLTNFGLGTLNPIRYRGYYYDQETNWYYVASRYYDPENGRWINADNQLSTGSDLTGMNLFAYCGSNPVNRIDLDGHAWKDVKNWFSNTWNNVKKTAKQIVETVKEKGYTAYYNATKWHFEDREKKNGTHPTYSEVNDRNSGWNLLPESQSIYHDNGVGKSELKYITDDGREAVFDGDTLEPVTDPRYIATYNYCPLYQMPSTGAGVLDYVKLAGSGVGHFFADMLPYYLTGNSNTREQFESKVFLFD